MTSVGEVLRILNARWDPIGLAGLEQFDPEVDDEYYSYAVTLKGMIERNGTHDEIRSYLIWAEKNMGLQPSNARVEEVSKALLGLDA